MIIMQIFFIINWTQIKEFVLLCLEILYYNNHAIFFIKLDTGTRVCTTLQLPLEILYYDNYVIFFIVNWT